MLVEVDGKCKWQVPICSLHAVYWRWLLSPTLLLPLLQHPYPQFSQGSQVQGVTCASEGLAINLDVPTVLSLGLINLLAWFIELRNLLLIQSLVYYKCMHLGSSRWKRCLGWGLGRAMELPCPSPNPLSHRFHGGSPTWPCFGEFSGVSLQRRCNSVLGYWSLSSISAPRPSPGSGVGTGQDWKLQTCDQWLLLLTPSPHSVVLCTVTSLM